MIWVALQRHNASKAALNPRLAAALKTLNGLGLSERAGGLAAQATSRSMLSPLSSASAMLPTVLCSQRAVEVRPV